MPSENETQTHPKHTDGHTRCQLHEKRFNLLTPWGKRRVNTAGRHGGEKYPPPSAYTCQHGKDGDVELCCVVLCCVVLCCVVLCCVVLCCVVLCCVVLCCVVLCCVVLCRVVCTMQHMRVTTSLHTIILDGLKQTSQNPSQHKTTICHGKSR